MVALGRLAALASTLSAYLVSASPVSLSEFADVEKRCTWNDAYGPVDCNYFVVTIGENGIVTINGYDQNEASGFWAAGGEIDCIDLGADGWTTYDSPLPYTVDIQGGNQCLNKASAFYDNTHISYAGTFLNLPTDTRCGPVDGFRRCIIAINP